MKKDRKTFNWMKENKFIEGRSSFGVEEVVVHVLGLIWHTFVSAAGLQDAWRVTDHLFWYNMDDFHIDTIQKVYKLDILAFLL